MKLEYEFNSVLRDGCMEIKTRRPNRWLKNKADLLAAVLTGKKITKR